MSVLHCEFYSRVSNEFASIANGGVSLIGYAIIDIGVVESAAIPAGCNLMRLTAEEACFIINAASTPDFDTDAKQYIAAGRSFEVARYGPANLYCRSIVVGDPL